MVRGPHAPTADQTQLLAGRRAELRAKLTEKVRYHAMADIDPQLPTSEREGPVSATGDVKPSEAALQRYAAAIRETAKIFASSQHKKGQGHPARA